MPNKKAVLLLILAFLFQMHWNIATAYCAHESGKAAQHLGHHPHQHQASKADAESPQKSFQSHADCVSCFSMMSIAPVLESNTIPTLSVTHESHSPLLKILMPFLAMPERPQWLA